MIDKDINNKLIDKLYILLDYSIDHEYEGCEIYSLVKSIRELEYLNEQCQS